ncbi:MAG: ATP-binding protein [Candidatus Zixiibacteriota bacterium]
MSSRASTIETRLGQRSLVVIFLIIAAAVLAVTWIGIRESRNDSFRLLVLQGTAFTEALAEASENAIAAEMYYDRLAQRRYMDLAGELFALDTRPPSNAMLASYARAHDLNGIYLYGADSILTAAGTARGERLKPPEWIDQEVRSLIAHPVTRSVLLNEANEETGENVQYYLEIANELDRVIVFSSDARSYNEALSQTGIGFLAQRMAQEKGVEYIIYQSTRGIIFSSRKVGDLLAIESDPFLKSALDSDTIMNRLYDFQGTRVLELVRPFATRRYPFGLFRIGMSLDGFYRVSRGYDRQMIVMSAILFALVVVAMLYINSRHRRREISRQFSDIKTLTDRIFEQMKVGVVACDEDGIVRLANDSFVATMGISQAVGRPRQEIAGLNPLQFDSFMTGQLGADEFETHITVNNSRRTLLVARSKVIYEDSRRTGVVAVTYDITRYREYEQEAARRERLSEMGNLAAGVAHEIRNPLNTISIAAQRLASEFSPSERSEEYAAFTEKIRTETKRLNDIITRFLALAREEKKRSGAVDLSAVIASFAALVKAEAEKLDIRIDLSVDTDLHVAGAADSLHQVLLNLYNNAKEALGGHPGRMSLAARRDGDRVLLSFDDSGPGIPVELREKVFTPYFTTKEVGTGLGLPTVHRIISDLGGTVAIGESPLGGAAFVISLPSI